MGFVNHHRGVLGQDGNVFQHINGEQRVVSDHDVGLLGLFAGDFSKAILDQGARLPHALPATDTEGPPDSLFHGGCEFELVARAGFLGPGPQVLGLLAHFGGCPGFEVLSWHGVGEGTGIKQRGGTGIGNRLGRWCLIVNAIQTHIVIAPLQHGEGGTTAQDRFNSLDQRGDVTIDQLGLQSNRCSSHDDGVVMQKRRN